MIGKTFAQYTIVERLGAGGMGEVYRASDSRLGRDVALKVLPESVAGDPDRLHRFTLEARLLASLNHSNVGAIYDLVEAGDARFLVLELIEGETLSQRIARGALTTRETLKVGRQIASAVEAAHEKGIIHRDLKPDNVMLTRSRAVKVLDFGLAKGSESATPTPAATQFRTQTAKGVVLGTAPYMSPEQARGQEVDRRTDVWAFGCILYECLAGHRAFHGDTGSDIIARILERDPEWRDLPGNLPPRLGDLMRSCLRKDVDLRPRDIGDLRRELEAIENDLSSASFGSSSSIRTVPSLAVLYFENQSGNDEDAYFCAGITEDILTDLSKIRGLRVASRNAVLPLRGQAVDIPTVAADLAVDAVLEGSVRRAGDRVRITAQLIGADGFQLWAERYDRTLQDVFAVQEEIASAITEALRVALTPAEAGHLVKDRPADARAYDLYLQGREQYQRYTADSLREALRLFEQAVAVDPDYALAWAGVADAYGQLCQYDFSENRAETARLGLEAAARAIRLNPGLAEGYKAQALVQRFSGDLEGSRASLIQALEVNPRLTPALINLAVQQVSMADLAGAERLLRRALDIDPQENFARIWIAALTLNTGRFEEAMALAQEILGLAPTGFHRTGARLFTVLAHLRRGDDPATERALREAVADGADPAHMRAAEARLAARTGRIEDAKRLVRSLQDDVSITTGALLSVAAAAVRTGDTDAAIRVLGRNVVKGLAPIFVRLEPDLQPLASQEPFAPRRLDAVLNWPLEAPMIDRATFALFREVHIKSGVPKGSDLLLDDL